MADLDGFLAVEELVRRAGAGMAVDEALAGLDLGYDEHGRHGSEHILHPTLWRRAPAPACLLAADWLIDSGADAAQMLAGSVLQEVPRLTEHLLASRPLLDLCPALVAAFRMRRLGLARELVERGADPAALAALVRADLVTPRTVEVRYRASENEQRVTFSVRVVPLARPVHDLPQQVRHHASLLQRLGERGLLGSDLFDPATSRVSEESCVLRVVDGGHELVSVLRVRGVAPAGLALVFRSLVGRQLACHPTALVLEGEEAPTGDERSVDTARALSWFADVDADRVRPPKTLRFPVVAKAKQGAVALVEHAAGLGRTLHAAVSVIDPEALAQRSVGWDFDAPSAEEHLDSKLGDKRTEIVLRSFGAARVASPDRELLRNMLLHATAALEGVTSLRWCSDAGLTAEAKDAQPTASPKRPARAQKGRAPAIEHPALGPSRVPELRAALGARARPPWSEVGAPRGELPRALGRAKLPPTLLAWLSHDDAVWPLPKDAPLVPRAFSACLAACTPGLAGYVAPLEASLLTGECVPLFVPSSCADGTVLFLYLPFADASGEAPVLGYDPTDDGLVGVFAPRFDHYLARVLDADRHPFAFGTLPGTAAYLQALVLQLPARLRKKVRAEDGVLWVGGLLEA